MNYDHHEKAGNPGDVVKHVALTAALRAELASASSTAKNTKSFIYADTFAAYAQNPILGQHRRQWNGGIGRTTRADVRSKLEANEAAKTWLDRYLPAARSDVLGGMYPGSAAIACDEVRAARRTPSLRLWDVSLEAVENLRMFFPEDDGHRVFQESAVRARAIAESVREAHFVFVDPPGHDDRDGAFPTSADLALYFELPVVLMWLPLFGRTEVVDEQQKVVGEMAKCTAIRLLAQERGLATVAVKTGSAMQGFGCQLFLRLSDPDSEKAVDDAIKTVIDAYGWSYTDGFRYRRSRSCVLPPG